MRMIRRGRFRKCNFAKRTAKRLLGLLLPLFTYFPRESRRRDVRAIVVEEGRRKGRDTAEWSGACTDVMMMVG